MDAATLEPMRTARRLHHSYEEYLRALELSEVKLEFCDGEIYAMAGGTPAHADLTASIVRLLGNALLGKCRVSSSDLKVRIEQSGLTTFPDATVVCGQREVAEMDANAVTNPTLLVEVTSPSTEEYDRGAKLEHYKQIPSLVAVLFISHRQTEVTLVTRREGEWTETVRREGEDVVLAEPSLRLAVSEIYDGIALAG